MEHMDRFRDAFLAETRRLLDELGTLILDGEGQQALSPQTARQMFRVLHTIKGSAGMMNLSALSALTHTLEGLFVRLQKDGRMDEKRKRRLFDLLLEALDAMRGELDMFAADGEEHQSYEGLIAKLNEWKSGDVGDRVLRIRFSADCAMENVRAYIILSALRASVSELAYWPSDLETEGDAARRIRENGLYIRFSAADEQAVRQALAGEQYVAEVADADDFPGEGALREAQAPETQASEAPVAPEGQRESLVSIQAQKLENLQGLVSELILTQSQMLWDSGKSDTPEAAALLRKSEALRSAVIALRMTPVSALVERLHRAAREAARKLDKQIAFSAAGGDAQIDKSLLDALSESLVQIVRNAAVHGVEPPGERVAAGKPPAGAIAVSARNAGTSVVITVTDDGRGVSAQRVAQAARDAGMTLENDPETSRELLALLVRPGVTTRPEADELSGRGMGLDVVASAIRKLRGTLEMETRVGQGTTFTVRVPQSLAVMDCVRFRVKGAALLLPSLDIHTLLQPRASDIVTLPDGRRRLSFKGYSLPLYDLGALYGLRAPCPDMEGGVIAVLEGETNAVAVYADGIEGSLRAAIRPLPELLNSLGARELGLAGGVILSDRRVGYVLDARTLLEAKEA